MCGYVLRNVPFLVHPDLEPEFMCNLAIKFSTHVFSRLERLMCLNIFIVERGVVAKHGRLGLAGSCFGRDIILSNENLRDLGDAIALTFVQSISLTQQDIFSLLPEFPGAQYVIRRAALRMAIVNGMVRAAQIVKRARRDFTHSAQFEQMSVVDVFDLALREAAVVQGEQQKQRNSVDGERKSITLKELSLMAKTTESFKKSVEDRQGRRRASISGGVASAGDSGGGKKTWSKLAASRVRVAAVERQKALLEASNFQALMTGGMQRAWQPGSPNTSPEREGSSLAALRTRLDQSDQSVSTLRDLIQGNHETLMHELERLHEGCAPQLRPFKGRMRRNPPQSGVGGHHDELVYPERSVSHAHPSGRSRRPKYGALDRRSSTGTSVLELAGAHAVRHEGAGQPASTGSINTTATDELSFSTSMERAEMRAAGASDPSFGSPFDA